MNSDYNYRITEAQGRNVILIEDLNLGGKSVTNDIENVVSTISKTEGIDTKDYMIVYRDSMGIWDGWNGDFVALRATDWEAAVRRYIKTN
jgi:hypothetical protein